MNLFDLRERISGSFWVLPALIVAGGGAAAFGLLEVDEALQDAQLEFAFAGGPESARSLLSTIASSMITFTGLVFSITLVVLTLASNQYSPRVLRTFLRDRQTQVALGLFIATFVYALVALRAVRSVDSTLVEEPFVPGVTLTVSFLLVLVAVGVFVHYISHVIQMIRAEHIIGRIAEETRKTVERVCPEAGAEGEDHHRELASGTPPDAVVPARRPGVVTDIDAAALVGCAAAADVVLSVARGIGSFVPEGAPLVEVRGVRVEEVDERAVGQAVVLSAERSTTHDIAFGFRQLVDIAERALSPGTNDPTTAVQALDQIHDLLRRLATRPLPDGRHHDDDGRLRVTVPTASWDDYVALALDEVRHWGAGSLQVQQRVRELLDDLLTVAVGSRVRPLVEQRRLLDARRSEALPEVEARRVGPTPAP